MSLTSHTQAANAIRVYAEANNVWPEDLVREASRSTLDSALKAGQNSQAFNIEIAVNLEGLGTVKESDLQQPFARRAVDKAAQTIDH